MDGQQLEPLQSGGVPSAQSISSEISKLQDTFMKQQPGSTYAGGKHSETVDATDVPCLGNPTNSPAGTPTPASNKSVAFSKPLSVTIKDEAFNAGSSHGPYQSSRSTSNGRNVSHMGNISSAAGTHHALLRVGSRSKVEALLAPPASDAATLRRQVETLQLDLEAHLESEHCLQSINQQLRDRLELYMKQNHENVERAESELNILHEDMEQTLELQRRLAQKSTSLEKDKKEVEQTLKRKLREFEAERCLLQAQIDRMSEDLRVRSIAQAQANAIQADLETTLAAKGKLEQDLKSYMAETEFLQRKAEEYNSDLCKLLSKEKREILLEKSCRRCLLWRFFRRLKEAVKEHRMIDAFEQAACSFARRKCSRRGLQALRMASARAKQMRVAQSRHAQARLQEFWRSWWLSNLASKKFKDALQHRQKTQIGRMLTDWRIMIEMGRMSDDEETRLTDLAKKHWHAALQRHVWKHWIQWVRFWIKPQRKKLKYVQKHLDRLLCRQAIAAWKCLIRVERVNRLREARILSQVMLFCQKRSFSRWREGLRFKTMKRLMNMKALQFRRLRLCRAFMNNWCKYLQWRTNVHMAKAVAFRHYLCVLQSKALGAWKYCVKQQQAESRALQEVNRALARAAMVFWHDYHALYSIKKSKERRADVHRKRRDQKVARILLTFWWEEMAWKRRIAHFECILASRRRRTLLYNSLHCWMHSTFDHLLVSNAKFQSDLLEAKAQYEDQKHQTTAVDVENLQLIDRLHTMSSEIAHLKINISEKEKQEEDLHRALEDNAIIEGSMRAELEQQHLQIEELEMESMMLQKKLQIQTSEDTVGEVQHTLEIENLEQTLKDLQAQIDDKSIQIESYAKAFRETAEKLEGISDESHEQLNSAFEIGSSLRKLLEDRENQFATLEGNCRRRELELGEIQRKLSVASSAFSETVEARDSRIRDLESMLAQKQAEMQDAQQDLQDLQLAFDAKESHVRRLEYEIKLKAERDSQKTKAFVSSLSSWSSSAGQLDTLVGFRNNMHSIQLESMKHVYMQTKAALQQGISPDGCLSGYRLSAFKVQTKPSSFDRKGHGGASLQEEPEIESFNKDEKDSSDQADPLDFKEYLEERVKLHTQQKTVAQRVCNHENGPLQNPCEDFKSQNGHICTSRPQRIGSAGCSSEGRAISTYKGITASLQQALYPLRKSLKEDWEEGVSLDPTNKPFIAPEDSDSFCSPNSFCSPSDTNQERSAEHVDLASSRGHELLPEPVDSLHVEIQQLQARIMNRLRDSSKFPEEKLSKTTRAFKSPEKGS